MIQIVKVPTPATPEKNQPVRASATHLERLQREKRDVEVINANADRLNAEARDVLDYQRLP